MEKVKNQLTTSQKLRKSVKFSSPPSRFRSLYLKFFLNLFVVYHQGIISFRKCFLRQFGTVWFSLSFSSIKRKRYKINLLMAVISKTVRQAYTAKESIGKQMVEYRRQLLDLTPSNTNRNTEGQISVHRGFITQWPISLKFKYVVLPQVVRKACRLHFIIID